METLNKDTIKRGAITATLFATILMIAINVQVLEYDAIAAEPGRVLYNLVHDWLISWVTIFGLETGYTLYWIQKKLKEDHGTTVSQNTAKAEICLKNGGNSIVTMLACEDIYKGIL
jgi:hypothetical protein